MNQMDYNFVATPEVVSELDHGEVLCIGYPVEGKPVLLRGFGYSDGEVGTYREVAQLDDDAVDSIMESLQNYRQDSPQYRDNHDD